jgi:hypothetical protein
MDNKKFEQLINLITNEDVDQAKALFHDIVVEKSREIYESMMDEEDMTGQVGDLQDEISSEESGMNEEDDDLDIGDDMGDEEGQEIELGGDDEMAGDEFGGEEAGEEGLEDRVVSLEDKLDELMAEFEEIMGAEGGDGDADDFGGAPDGDADDMGGEFGGEEGGDDFGGDDMGDEEEPMMESAALQPVKGLYGSKIGGDDGVQNKSPALTKPKVVATGAKAVNFAGGAAAGTRTVPAPKEIPGTYKNAAGQKKQDLEAAPKPTTSQASGVNNKSVVESRKRK